MKRKRRTFPRPCRWCSTTYSAPYTAKRDGFCSSACKQAHWRAFTAYVTRKKDHCSPPVSTRNAKRRP